MRAIRIFLVFVVAVLIAFRLEPASAKITELNSELIKSSADGNAGSVRTLLESGANVNAQHKLTGWTPLIAACFYGHSEIVKMLIDSGANVNLKDRNGATPLMKAVVLGPYNELSLKLKSKGEIITRLMQAGADPQIKDNLGSAPWEMAIIQGHLELVKPFENANVRGVREIRLQQAIAAGNSLLAEELIKKGADVQYIDSDGWSALSEAALSGNTKILKLIMQHVSNVNLRHRQGWTALMVASERGHVECVKILLDAGADSHLRNKDGMTAQMIAAAKGHNPIVHLLQDH